MLFRSDYIFAFWGKHGQNGVPAPKYYLLDRINKSDITAYIDGSEWTSTGFLDTPTQCQESLIDPRRIRGVPWINEEMYNKCTWYFKRLVMSEDLERSKIVPCYIGAIHSYFTVDENYTNIKTNDIYCSFGGNAGHITTGLRPEVYNYLNKVFEEQKLFPNVKTIIGQRFETQDYFRTIKESYISISAWGAGNCCRRMWEIMANEACCFVQEPFIIYPNKFVDGESCVYYSSIDELIEKLNYYLNNKEKCIKIGKNSHNHIKRYHTGKQRVKYMLNVMSGGDWQHEY